MLALPIALIGADAFAQVPTPSLQDQINAAARIRVLTPQVRAEVERPRLANDSLSWSTGTAMSLRSGRTIPLTPPLALGDVTRVEIRNGTHAARGAAIGGGIGAVLGLTASAAMASDEFFSDMSTGDYVVVIAVPTLGGAILGAIIGTAVPRWETVYVQNRNP
ncbi:MAG: hypothetical protein ACREMV_13965 [Gemmatimonadales bacterium]